MWAARTVAQLAALREMNLAECSVEWKVASMAAMLVEMKAATMAAVMAVW